MTVTTTEAQVDFSGDGTRTLFTYDFRILEEEHLLVFIDGEQQILGVDYFLQNLTNVSGQVSFTTAPPTGTDNIHIERRTPVEQLVNFRLFGPYAAQNNELVHDKPTLIIQELLHGGRAAAVLGGRNLSLSRQRYSVTVENDRGTNALIPIWAGSATEAGSVAGEVVEEGPTNGTPSPHDDGYLIFECGDPGASEITTALCGSLSDVTPGDLLASTVIPFARENYWTVPDPLGEGITFSNTKVICGTIFFTRDGPGYSLCSNPNTSYLFDVWDSDNSVHAFAVYIDANGYLQFTGANAAGTEILSLTIKNNGGSFGDQAQHQFSFVIDLSDNTRRQIGHNKTDITNNTDWCVWNTYTDDTLALEDNGTTQNRGYAFGQAGFYTASSWADSDAGDALYQNWGFFSFDDSCTLIAPAIWDADGDIRDPQQWQGWYKTRPAIFMMGQWRNTGRFEPTAPSVPFYTEQVLGTSSSSVLETYDQSTTHPNHVRASAIVNDGLGSKTAAV